MTDHIANAVLHFNSGMDFAAHVELVDGQPAPTYMYPHENPDFASGDVRTRIPFVYSHDLNGVSQYNEAKLDA